MSPAVSTPEPGSETLFEPWSKLFEGHIRLANLVVVQSLWFPAWINASRRKRLLLHSRRIQGLEPASLRRHLRMYTSDPQHTSTIPGCAPRQDRLLERQVNKLSCTQKKRITSQDTCTDGLQALQSAVQRTHSYVTELENKLEQQGKK